MEDLRCVNEGECVAFVDVVVVVVFPVRVLHVHVHVQVLVPVPVLVLVPFLVPAADRGPGSEGVKTRIRDRSSRAAWRCKGEYEAALACCVPKSRQSVLTRWQLGITNALGCRSCGGLPFPSSPSLDSRFSSRFFVRGRVDSTSSSSLLLSAGSGTGHPHLAVDEARKGGGRRARGYVYTTYNNKMSDRPLAPSEQWDASRVQA